MSSFKPKKWPSLFFIGAQILVNSQIYYELTHTEQSTDKQFDLLMMLLMLGVSPTLLFILTSCKNPGFLEMEEKSAYSLGLVEHQKNQGLNENTSNQIFATKRKSLQFPTCQVCNIKFAFRQKHCRQCNKCVSTFDHHCPFLGICIGEKNHLVFYLFLLTFTVQLSIVFVWLFQHLIFADKKQFGVTMISIILIIFGLIAILLGFQTFLISKNITTRQYLKETHKIWYLQQLYDERKQKGKYQFNYGLVTNLQIFWSMSFQKKDQRINWLQFITELSSRPL